MITQAEVKNSHTPEEYLELEINAQARHEFIDGEIVEMTGGLPNHNQIALNLSGALNFALKRQPYRVFVLDQRLWIPQSRIYTYPHVMVVQGELQLQEGRRDIITNPIMIAEVLSDSTKAYDRDKKFKAYRTIPGFQEYLLIEQEMMYVEQYVKTESNQWIFSEYDSAAILSLSTIPFELSLAELYDKIDFEVEAEPLMDE
jgi:Uma2 family endonuclease